MSARQRDPKGGVSDVLLERAVSRLIRERAALIVRLQDNQSAWTDEERSVQDEHAALIRANARLLAMVRA